MIGQLGCAALRKLLRHPACIIQRLSIRDNYLDDACMDILNGGLGSNNFIKRIKQGCAALRTLMRRAACKIQCLRINNNLLDNAGMDTLNGGLIINTSIKSISISNQRFVTASGWSVFFAFFSNSVCSVERIDACGNDIGDDGVISLGDSLGTNRSIKMLDLMFSRSITPLGWQEFSKGLRSPTCSLLELDISQCTINDEGAIAIASALGDNASLEKLDMSLNSYITSSGWNACFDIMRQNVIRLKQLDLSYNKIDDVGATKLVTILVKMSALDSFSLQWMSSVSADGWRELAGVVNPIISSSKLCVLKLGRGMFPPLQIDDSVIICFADALIDNTCLTTLSFANYGLSEVGLSSLADCLCDKSSLVNTFLSNHTLQSFSCRSSFNGDLRSLLVMNRCKNKFEVARKKILATHFVDDGACGRIFDPMPAPTFPTALSWIGRDRREYSMMYNFLRSMPWLLQSEAIASTE